MRSLRVGHDWATSLWLFIFLHWRRKWQPTPVFLPGESQGRGSLMGCCRGVAQSRTRLKRLSSSSSSSSSSAYLGVAKGANLKSSHLTHTHKFCNCEGCHLGLLWSSFCIIHKYQIRHRKQTYGYQRGKGRGINQAFEINIYTIKWGVSDSSIVKNLLAMQEMWVWSLVQEASPGGGNSNPLQYSCLGNPTDRGAWRATVHRVAKELNAT